MINLAYFWGLTLVGETTKKSKRLLAKVIS